MLCMEEATLGKGTVARRCGFLLGPYAKRSSRLLNTSHSPPTNGLLRLPPPTHCLSEV